MNLKEHFLLCRRHYNFRRPYPDDYDDDTHHHHYHRSPNLNSHVGFYNLDILILPIYVSCYNSIIICRYSYTIVWFYKSTIIVDIVDAISIAVDIVFQMCSVVADNIVTLIHCTYIPDT
ncbi:Hypothetical predicted protein [Octopus vulgaris]|uniref:Uncharacterized protein n=1 Tax=Octopus vulgaris TaxID=6645 RepID=A0AA36F7R1_OCTVU|nr:Hypothetical predicted protein [Octopus vulgaris]